MMSDDFKKLIQNIGGLYGSIGYELDKCGGVHRCKVCGFEIPHQSGDGARYTKEGYPKHCGKSTRWVTQKELNYEEDVDIAHDAMNLLLQRSQSMIPSTDIVTLKNAETILTRLLTEMGKKV